MKNAVAMILAGGRGSRMDILCQGRPKPLLPLAGRLRVIDFSLSNCIHSGIGNVAVLVDYQRQHLADYLEEWRSVNGAGNGLDILEPKSCSYRGTVDAVYQNLDHLKKHNPDAVLVLAADHVYRMDYRRMLAFHQQMDADVTVAVDTVPIEQARRFGIVTADAHGRILDFAEKPQVPTSNLASMGIYVFKRQALVDYLVEDSGRPDSPHDFGYGCIPQMVKENRVFSYKFDDYWQDIGSVEAYYNANMELLREVPSLGLNGRWPILTTCKGLYPFKLSHQGNVRHSLVSPGCVIKGEVQNSVLSPGVRVEEQAVVKDSIIMANTVIGKHSMVERCIVDEGVNVGEFCYVGFGNSIVPGGCDITVLGRDVSVPAGTAIGRSCMVLPEVKRPDFTGSVVLAGSVLSHRQTRGKGRLPEGSGVARESAPALFA